MHARDEQERCKARVKARLLGRPELRPRIGHFELLALLGQGATGVVYEARDTRSGASVAVKLLSHLDPRAVTLFKREFRALAELAHDNLVQLHELFADGDQWYFSMELVRGLPFTDYLLRRDGDPSSCDLDRLRPALLQLLRAVGFLHDAGRVHCDLKPSNVLVTDEGRVVVLDFSLVSLVSTSSATTSTRAPAGDGLRGTPPFVAPELYTGAPHTPSSDAYAIGMMLLRALHGADAGVRATARADTEARGLEPSIAGSEVDSHTIDQLEQLCAELLESDPAVRLGIDVAVARLDGTPARLAAHAPVTDAFFVGRERELALLEAAFADCRQDAPSAVFISGPSGIGKSALCDRLADALSQRAIVLRGRCYEREALPYKAFDGVIEALAEHVLALPRDRYRELAPPQAAALARMFPSLRAIGEWLSEHTAEAPAPESQLRERAFSGLKALLRVLAEQRPLLLIVDDLQWADADSAALLLEILGPPSAPALLFVGCHRPDAGKDGELLDAFLQDAVSWQCRRTVLELEKLEDGAARDLAQRLFQAPCERPADSIERIVREANGSPLLLRELARHAARDRGALAASPSLSDLFAERIAELRATARIGLVLLALAARPLPSELLAQALTSYPDHLSAMRSLLGSGLVRRGRHPEWVIQHDALREHVLQLVDATQASALHGVLATACERTRSAEPEWLVYHWCAAGNGARALDYSISAARAAAHNLAFNRAAELYATALRLQAPSDPCRPQLQAELGESCANAGRSAQAAEAFLAAAGGATRELALRLRCRAVQQYFRSGQTTRGDALLEALAREVGIVYPRSMYGLLFQIAASRTRLSLLGLRRSVRFAVAAEPRSDRTEVLESVFREIVFVEPVRGALLLSLFHEAALASGRPEQLFIAQAWQAYASTARGGRKVRRQTARQLARLSRLAEQLASPYAVATVSMLKTAAALSEHRLGDVELHAARAARIFESQCLGAFWEESVVDALRYAAMEDTGPLTTLCERASVLLRRTGERSDLFADVMVCRTVSAALLARDQPERAIAFLQERLTALEPVMGNALDLRYWLVVQSLVDCQCYDSRESAAWESINRIWRDYLRSPFARANFTRSSSDYRRGRVAASLSAQRYDRELASIATGHAKSLLRMRNTWTRGGAFTILAALASQRGEFGEARRLLLEAEDSCRAIGAVVPGYAARLQRGRITPGLGGRQLVHEADRALRQLGVTNPARWSATFAGGIVVP